MNKPSRTNARRIARAENMLKARGKEYDPHDRRANLVDALADLRHWASNAGLDFEAAMQTSLMHYRAESPSAMDSFINQHFADRDAG